MTERPRLLIEDWLPVRELGIESRRERAVVTTLPPLNWLHVWWARRLSSRPPGSSWQACCPLVLKLAAAFPGTRPLQSEQAYHSWLLHLIGIWGDPVAARVLIDQANARGYKIEENPYGYRQAYRNSPDEGDISLLHAVLRHTWNDQLPLLADPTAGGGSIPFVAARLGIPTYANDLNAVAAALLRAGVGFPRATASACYHIWRNGAESSLTG